MMKKVGLFVVLFLVMGMSSAWAGCMLASWAEEKANSEVYYVKAGGMLVRGLDRIVGSPVELACHTYKGVTEDIGYGEGILKGLGLGTLWMVDDILRGAWDIITFAIPDYHGEADPHQQECWGAGAGEAKTTT